MPRKPNPVPTYRRHKQSGQAVATVRQPDGTRRDVLLGKYNSAESRTEYARLLAILAADPGAVVAGKTATRPPVAGITVNEVLLAFLRHADTHYRRPDGSHTSEPKNYRDALRPVRRLYGHTPAAEFGPLALKAVRQALIEAGHCRTLINQEVGRVRRVFKWAAGEELLSFDVYHRLTAVTGLARGRSAARESEPVKPVPVEVVLATLPFLSRQLAGMVRVQMLSGMRPGEVCRLRVADLDMAGDVWTFAPSQHKTGHRGKARRVKLGPQAQAVIREFMGGDPTRPLFSPWLAREERFATLRAARKSRVQPSQRDRSKVAPKKLPGTGYTTVSYGRGVAEAVKKAGVGHWHPNMLRHTFGTMVRQQHGLEAAQVLLGHSRADVTQVYAERDDGLAERVAAAVG